MNYDRVVGIIMPSQTITLGDAPLLEIQLPADTTVEIIRVEIGVAEGATPVDEVQEVQLYRGSTVGTGGTGIAEQVYWGSSPPNAVALRNLTAPGAGEAPLYQSAFHWQQGWVYLPVPEERIKVQSLGTDNFGIVFPLAPAVSVVCTATLVFGEVG